MSVREASASAMEHGRVAARLLWRRGAAGLLALRKRPWSGAALPAVGIWLATRVVFVLITYFALTFATLNHNSSLHLLSLAHSAWTQGDTVWYLNISQYGYWQPTAATFARDHGQPPTAFFPLYPLLIAAVTLVVGSSHRLLAGMLVSNLGVLAGFVGLGLLAAHETNSRPSSSASSHAASRAVLIAAAAPLAFFLTAAYSDSLFFAFAVFALLAARRGAWRWAMVCGALAGLTRFTAVVLVLPLAWEYATQNGWRPRLPRGLPRPVTLSGLGRALWEGSARLARQVWQAIPRERQTSWRAARRVGMGAVVAGGAPLGIALYAAYLWLRFGDPLSFLHAEQVGWQHVPTPPWVSIPHAIAVFFALPSWSYDQARTLVDYGVVLFILAITVIAARRMPVSFLLYLLSLLYLSIAAPVTWSFDIYISSGRYLLPAIPVYIVLGRWAARSPTSEAALLSIGFALQGLFTGLWLATNIGFI